MGSIRKTSNVKEQGVIEFVINTLKNELYDMEDGNIVHNMYNSEYDGTGYDITAKKLEKNEKLIIKSSILYYSSLNKKNILLFYKFLKFNELILLLI